ncbi:unnamed protein product [Medioppia subpectinata]|uniref:sn-1-specific diacylglycerol lipase n=2 Tax=Medioppia subpectinata TaxID=1979941 RepID=A0A7R9KR41_9ACAR|nr:unnamed protein product [Medioppia subpectinata]CAG2106899.1 unnamed protein product [Medioppia subpectinata]
MPGLVIFKRRWSVGSDDLVVPAAILLCIHVIWLIVLSVTASAWDQYRCLTYLYYTLGYIIILFGCVIVETFIVWLSMRGSILNTLPRSSMKYLLYIRIGIFVVEIVWMILSSLHMRNNLLNNSCHRMFGVEALFGINVCNVLVIGIMIVTIWCTYDAAGRSWVKMKVYQNSLKEGQSKFRYRRSGNSQRNWRHRIAVREYQDSWDRRCRLLFCCVGANDRQQNSFTEIAKLLSEFFRDLDVVPSDVIAGLILLRRHQRLERRVIVDKRQDNTFQFLSGVAITSNTKFLDVNHPVVAEEIRTLIHFLHYGLAVYGWPIFMMMNSATGCCQLFPHMKCCSKSSGCCLNCSATKRMAESDERLAIDDNCCQCNYAALKNMCQTHNYELIYATYHVAIGEPPFFVALDYDKRSVVISVRGTLSLHDVITDLNAEGELLPTDPIHEDWLAHKGMVEAALYIRNKLKVDDVLNKALNYAPERGTQSFNIILVGHSLGAGTAAILAILLKQEFPDLICFAFAPPGGLLSAPAIEYTKEFIISVVLGKDVVPRLGLHQMETLRFDLINAIKQCLQPKWNVIGGGALCCCPHSCRDTKHTINCEDVSDLNSIRELSSHPIDDSIALTVHPPLYPPGRIIHLVRNHPKKSENFVGKKEPIFQALWADNTNFNEILISPVMIQDHMPDKMLDALEKLLVHTGPAKPQRKIQNTNINTNENTNTTSLPHGSPCQPTNKDTNFECPQNILLETSFTDSPLIAQNIKNEKSLTNRSVRPSHLMTFADTMRVDLMRDDWFGAAPLASPETLSDDTSSISSRSTGVRASWATLPVFTINDKQLAEQKVVRFQPKANPESHYSNMSHQISVNRTNDAMNIPLGDNDIIINPNINRIDVLNKNLCDNQKAMNFNLNSLNAKSEDINERNGLFGLLEVKDENYNPSSNSSDNNVQDLNSGEILNSRCESTNENESLAAIHRCSSDTDMSLNCDPKPQPLRRSHEEIHLNNLDDTANVFEGRVLNNNEQTIRSNDTNSGEVSPTLQILFHKLLTIESIESPTSESAANATECDPDVNANQISSHFTGNQF